MAKKGIIVKISVWIAEKKLLARIGRMKWIWRVILLNTITENHKLKIAKHFYLQGMGGWSESERIPCETQLIMHYFDLWGKYKRWFKLQHLIHKELLNKSYLQGVRGCSESEGISYQTPILTIKKWKPKSVLDQSQKLSRSILFKGS